MKINSVFYMTGENAYKLVEIDVCFTCKNFNFFTRRCHFHNHKVRTLGHCGAHTEKPEYNKNNLYEE